MLLEELVQKLGELYKLPVYSEGVLPSKLIPFVTLKRGNKVTLPLIDLLSTTGGILVFRSTGCSSNSARVVSSCDFYVRLYQSLKDEVKGYTGAIPSANIMILFYGSYDKEKVLDLNIFPLELIDSPKIIGMI